MILHNTTFIVDPSANDFFLDWATSQLLPAAQCESAHMPELLSIISDDDSGTFRYALHFRTDTTENAEKWQEKLNGIATSCLGKLMGSNVLWFSTMMETFVTSDHER